MGSARARPGPILPGLKIRAPTETGSPSGPKTDGAARGRPLGHPVGDPRAGEKRSGRTLAFSKAENRGCLSVAGMTGLRNSGT